VTIGFGVLVANGFSLAYTNYLKGKEYEALYNREKRRERWECDNYIEGEQREMVQLYMEKGLSKADAETVIKILSKDKSIFVEVMMKEELQLIQPDELIKPLKNAILLFVSTIIFGMFPLSPFFMQWFGMTELSLGFQFQSVFGLSIFISLSFFVYRWNCEVKLHCNKVVVKWYSAFISWLCSI